MYGVDVWTCDRCGGRTYAVARPAQCAFCGRALGQVEPAAELADPLGQVEPLRQLGAALDRCKAADAAMDVAILAALGQVESRKLP